MHFAVLIVLQMDGFLVERVRFFTEPLTGPVQMGIIPAFDDPPREGPF